MRKEIEYEGIFFNKKEVEKVYFEKEDIEKDTEKVGQILGNLDWELETPYFGLNESSVDNGIEESQYRKHQREWLTELADDIFHDKNNELCEKKSGVEMRYPYQEIDNITNLESFASAVYAIEDTYRRELGMDSLDEAANRAVAPWKHRRFNIAVRAAGETDTEGQKLENAGMAEEFIKKNHYDVACYDNINNSDAAEFCSLKDVNSKKPVVKFSPATDDIEDVLETVEDIDTICTFGQQNMYSAVKQVYALKGTLPEDAEVIVQINNAVRHKTGKILATDDEGNQLEFDTACGIEVLIESESKNDYKSKMNVAFGARHDDLEKGISVSKTGHLVSRERAKEPFMTLIGEKPVCFNNSDGEGLRVVYGNSRDEIANYELRGIHAKQKEKIDNLLGKTEEDSQKSGQTPSGITTSSATNSKTKTNKRNTSKDKYANAPENIFST